METKSDGEATDLEGIDVNEYSMPSILQSTIENEGDISDVSSSNIESRMRIDLGMVVEKAPPTTYKQTNSPSTEKISNNQVALNGDDLYISNIDTANDYDDTKYEGSEIIDMEISKYNGTETSDRDSVSDKEKEFTQNSVYQNYILFSILFALNHGGVASCISFATTHLDDFDETLSSYHMRTLHGSYALAAVMGVAYAVKSLGGHGKSALTLGMGINCVYVTCVALAITFIKDKKIDDNGSSSGRIIIMVICGALGGIGGALLWTAQGSYFTQVSSKYADASKSTKKTVDKATKELAGQFAAIYFAVEVVIRIFCTVAVVTFKWNWKAVYLGCISVSVLSALCMGSFVTYYGDEDIYKSVRAIRSASLDDYSTLGLFWNDRKIRYMAPICVLFPLVSYFMASFIEKHALIIAFGKNETIYLKLIGVVATIVAASASVPFARLAQKYGNGVVLVMGILASVFLSLLVLVIAGLELWNLGFFLALYGLQGIGKATFVGNLRSQFSVMFVHNKESAFANIVFWEGLFASIGFILTTVLKCSSLSTFCIKYGDGSIHDALLYQLFVLTASSFAILGLMKLSQIMRAEKRMAQRLSKILNYLGE